MYNNDDNNNNCQHTDEYDEDEWKIPLPPPPPSRQHHHPSDDHHDDHLNNNNNNHSRQRHRSTHSNPSTPLLPSRRQYHQSSLPSRSRPRSSLSSSSVITPFENPLVDNDNSHNNNQQRLKQKYWFSSPSRTRTMGVPVNRDRTPLRDSTPLRNNNNSANVSFLSTGDYSSVMNERKPSGISGFFFGFMYEEPFEDSFSRGAGDGDDSHDDLFNDSFSAHTNTLWNPINVSLCAMYTMTTAAATVPILLVPTIAKELEPNNTSNFASRAVASSVMGTACGKFLNGPVSDVMGARRTSILFSFLLSLTLLTMGSCQESSSVIWSCFFVEFFQSVQWPCILITLATHYSPQHIQPSKHKLSIYEGGIYLTSIASRFGSLLAIPLFSTILDDTSNQWRWVCYMGTWFAMIGTSVSYLFLADSPHRINEPQNPLRTSVLKEISDGPIHPSQFIRLTGTILKSMLMDNLLPSLQHVLKSGTFWIVALAHTGSSMIRTSERILTTYYHDTSMGFLSQEKASDLSIFASLGTIIGLATCGTYFSSLSQERHRKQFISRLYMFTIASCYALAIFAIPSVYNTMNAPGLVLFFQIFASFCMSLGISVMLLIPGLVGSAFGNHKGLFSAYVDGIAYGIASFVWKIVGNSVGDHVAGVGWAYGWAAVALLVILCAILMTEFFEHYFVRPSFRNGMGTYETIILA